MRSSSTAYAMDHPYRKGDSEPLHHEDMIDEGRPVDLSGWRIVKFFALGVVLVIISDVPNSSGVPFFAARGALLLLLFATLIMPSRPAVFLLFLLAIAGQDIVFGTAAKDADTVFGTASIWQIRYGPVRPSWVIFGCLCWQLVRLRRLVVPSLVRHAALWFATVPVVAGVCYGGFFTENAGVEVVNDIKFALMLIASTILFVTVLKDDRRAVYRILAAFIGVLLARHLMDLVYLVRNTGPMIALDVSRGSTDSAKGAVAFLVFFGMILILTQKRFLLGMAITVASVVLLIGYGTRNLWITFTLGVVVMMLSLGLRRSVLFAAVGAVVLVGGAVSLVVVNPQAAAVCYGRSQDITVGRPREKYKIAVDENFLSRMDSVRYAQILDVFDSIERRFAFLWGTGYGGYYEDEVVRFPKTLRSAFPQYSFETRKYYRTHSFSTHMFLKYGLLGALCISALWWVPGYALFKRVRRGQIFGGSQPRMLRGVLFCIVAFLPTAMLQTYWSGKGLYINGLIIALCLVFTRHSAGSIVTSASLAEQEVRP